MPLPFIHPRPESTILIQAREWTARIDLSRSEEAYRVRHYQFAEAPSLDDENRWITNLLQAKPPPARTVTLLSVEFLLVSVELPEGSDADQLQEVAAIEAEQIGGLGAADALTSVHRLPSPSGLVRCLAVQCPWDKLIAMRRTVAGCGCRLESMGHPAGFLLETDQPQLEHWPGLSLLNHGTGRGRTVEIWHGDEAQTDATALAANHEGILTLSAFADAKDAAWLGNREWFERWAEAMAHSKRPLDRLLTGVPLVRVPAPPVDRQQQIAIGAGGLVVALLLAFGHAAWKQHHLTSLESQLEEARRPADELADLDRQIREARSRLAQGADAASGPVFLEPSHQKRRMGHVLDGIINSHQSGMAVTAIKPDQGSLRVEAMTLNASAAQAMASELQQRLGAHGWQARLVRRTALLSRDDGGPWEVEFALRPVPPRAVESAATNISHAEPKELDTQ